MRKIVGSGRIVAGVVAIAAAGMLAGGALASAAGTDEAAPLEERAEVIPAAPPLVTGKVREQIESLDDPVLAAVPEADVPESAIVIGPAEPRLRAAEPPPGMRGEPQDREQVESELHDFAFCMRRRGHDVEGPDGSRGDIAVRIRDDRPDRDLHVDERECGLPRPAVPLGPPPR